MKDPKAKGAKRELKSKKLLESAGYEVTKSGGSLGAFDLIGISSTDFVLVQVKSNRWPSPAERETIKDFPCPPNCRKLVHRWDDYKRAPLVKDLSR